MRRFYRDSRHGQIHVREWASSGEETAPPLLCLHPAPYSGAYFETVAPLLNAGRRILAPDYPGFGGSDSLSQPPAISDYADAMLDAFEGEKGFHVAGFHTGCLVAVEMGITADTKIQSLIIIDVPYFEGETQAGLKEKTAQPFDLTPDLECLQKAWDFNVASRVGVMALERSFALFIEQLRPGTKDYYGFNAAFSYDCKTRFSSLATPTTIVATRSGLLDATHAAAAQVPHARLIDVEDITTAVFETGAESIAKVIISSLETAHD